MFRVRLILLILVLSMACLNGQLSLEFSQERGFFDTAFNLTITPSNNSATIRYTIDGSEPSPTAGTIYDGPIPVTTTTILRALAYMDDLDTSKISTHTYLFIDDVIRQPRTIDSWPNNHYNLGGGGMAEHDYEMDPDIVDSPDYAADLIRGLKEIPSLSIVMSKTDFWEMYDGDTEKKTSIELLYAGNEVENLQIDCGIKPHSHLRLKRSMRLSFKKKYGKSKWKSKIFRNAILGGESAVDEFDRIVLRGGNNRAWSRNWNEDRTTFTRDEWFRQSQIASSGLGSHGNFVHLYVNGLYWGLYNPVERPDESFTSSYLGGEKEDWFAISHGGIQGGDPSRYDYMMENLINKDLTKSDNYEELKTYLDIPHFIDYLIISWMTGVQDWPGNNWWGGNSTHTKGSFKYFGWDNEWSWDVTKNANNGAWVHPDFRANVTSGKYSALIFNKVKVNEDFMMTFADRAYKLCFNNGPMSDEQSRARWSVLNNYIRNAVVAESARWGDALEDGRTRTRDIEWQNEVERLDGLMDGNVERLMDALRNETYYPMIDPPLFTENNVPIELQEITVPNNYKVKMVNPNTNGAIFFTLDGSDPRLAGGEVSPSAQIFTENERTISQSTSLSARIKNGNAWSALHCLNIFIQDDLSTLKLTEIMYHPTDFEDINGRELEFLEIKNTSKTQTLDIVGLQIIEGVTFTFPIGTEIQPQQHIVLASNAEALLMKCPEVNIFGEYDGQLDNSGEQIKFMSKDGAVIIDVVYDDESPWPIEADGLGHSLVSGQFDPEGNQDNVDHWKLSDDNMCGSPGQDDPLSTFIMTHSPLTNKALIYPNPCFAKENVTIQSTHNIRSVYWVNSIGRMVSVIFESTADKEFVMKGPSQSGTYALYIVYEDGTTEIKMMVII